MTPPDIFCMHCKVIFDGFEAYQDHVEAPESIAEDD
jgi:hypothetical protein